MRNYKEDFPIFQHWERRGRPLTYLDTAAMAQMPLVVADAVREFSLTTRANVHRGVYQLNEQATAAYENARAVVREFLNARSAREVIFTRNTTEGINVVAQALFVKRLRVGDHVLIPRAEHHSNFLPWVTMAQKHGVVVDFVDFEVTEALDVSTVLSHLHPRTKVAAFAHVSNVLGAIHPVEELGKLFRTKGIIFVVDGAQAAPHIPVDVQNIGCDFFAMSGYKLGAPTGIGVLYGRAELLEEFEPVFVGGGMVERANLTDMAWRALPDKFEAGTPNAEGAVGLAAAIQYLRGVGFEELRRIEEGLLTAALRMLEKIPGARVFGPRDIAKRTGVISFAIENVHPHDLATILDHDGIAIRAGHHCTMPLHQWLGIPASSRASFWIYNTLEDVEKLGQGLERAVSLLRR